MVPERIRFVSLVMAGKNRALVRQMTSQASQLVRVTKTAEFVLTSLYIYLCVPTLQIDKESFNEIVHVMGAIRVNSFSISDSEN